MESKNLEFKKIRKRLGFTQGQMAKKLGVSWRQIQNYEYGKTPVPESTMKFLWYEINSLKTPYGEFTNNSKQKSHMEEEVTILKSRVLMLEKAVSNLLDENERLNRSLESLTSVNKKKEAG